MADQLQARVNALAGGAPLPQAETMTVARRLLGPMADRYGDVIGARPTSVQDIARDFAIGAMSGDPAKADELKMRVAETYRDQLRREEDQAFQREQAAREQINGFFELMKQGRTVPKELRKEFFKETLPQVGIEPTSPLFLKILSNPDQFGDIYDALSDPDLKEAMLNDPLAAVQKMIASGHDGALALGVAQQVQQMRRYRAETQGIIARTNRTNALAAQSPEDRQRAAFINKWAGRTIKDSLGRTRLITGDEIADLADKFYPRSRVAPTAGIAQAAPLAPAAPAPAPNPNASTPTTTPTSLAAPEAPSVTESADVAARAARPVGIPQAAAPSAEAGKQKVRRITGTVSRVE